MRSLYRAAILVGLLLSFGAMAATPTSQALSKLDELQARAIKEHWTFKVGYSPVMERSLKNITGFIQSKDWKKGQTFQNPRVNRDTVPAAYDWRDQTAGGLTPIKDQGQCGSCWAFGTVAVIESLVKIKDNVTKSFSEQQLVSCNSDGWGCSGGDFASKYHVSPGAALTSEFAYTGEDSKCKSGLTYDSKLESWAYVGNSDTGTPTTDQIKAAIYEYGPVAATVAASDSFQAYTTGIYNANDSDEVNHIISLVGWNDDGNYWILRNSWGSSWGEEGYMRIGYGVNVVGQQAVSAVYKPSCTPQPIVYTHADVTIQAGQSVLLGGMPVDGETYAWTPSTGLDNATVSSPLATPTATTTYTLVATNECGTASKTVKVTVGTSKSRRH